MKTKLARAARWLALALAVAGYCLLLWRGPWLIDGAHIRDTQLEPADGVVITGVRTMLVALGAGVIAGLGLYYTSRNHKLAQEQFKHTQKQFELSQAQFYLAQDQFRLAQNQASRDREKDRIAQEMTREAQVTERYVAAIKLLASDSQTERIGGVHSLHRIALDSPRDRNTIIQVLAVFHRESAAELQHQKALADERINGVNIIEGPLGPRLPSADDMEAAQYVLDALKGKA
ncbi:hypothetical protein ACIQMY_25380 [Streptomyces sp. NPDC091368]|uniref:hypothetical protein n=1 Tax=Streptomyces sp. NPDC091368 TaxID=3365993 RepID=UPI0037F2FDA9